MSKNFGAVDFTHLTFPNHLRIDYIRIYQPPQAINIGCSPPNFPTQDYINKSASSFRVKRTTIIAYPLSFTQVYRSLHEPKPHDVERWLRSNISEELFLAIMQQWWLTLMWLRYHLSDDIVFLGLFGHSTLTFYCYRTERGNTQSLLKLRTDRPANSLVYYYRVDSVEYMTSCMTIEYIFVTYMT